MLINQPVAERMGDRTRLVIYKWHLRSLALKLTVGIELASQATSTVQKTHAWQTFFLTQR